MKFVKRLYYYIVGKIILPFVYDKKYLKGYFYRGKLGGAGFEVACKDFFNCKRLGINKGVPFPVNPHTVVVGAENIRFDKDDLHIFQTPGCYFQAIGNIILGKGCYVAPNVGIITANHLFNDLTKHSLPKEVIIGKNCWIGMNSVILPGVKLGDNTIVGAGSVVTKSFEEGNCVICGNPAKKIKDLIMEKKNNNE